MDPHVDIVLPHDFRQDNVKLFPANLIIQFHRIFWLLLLSMESMDKEKQAKKCEKNLYFTHNYSPVLNLFFYP
jgi:hypothetical protein